MNVFYGPNYPYRKLVTEKPCVCKCDDTMPIEIDESSGLHVFEIHAPTAGISVFTIAIALVAIALAYGCYKKCCGTFTFTRQNPGMFPMQPMPPMVPFQQQAPYTAPPALPAPAPASPDIQPLLNMVALQAIRNQSSPLAIEQPRLQREPSGTIYTLPEEPVPRRPPSRPSSPVASAPSATAQSRRSMIADL